MFGGKLFCIYTSFDGMPCDGDNIMEDKSLHGAIMYLIRWYDRWSADLIRTNIVEMGFDANMDFFNIHYQYFRDGKEHNCYVQIIEYTQHDYELEKGRYAPDEGIYPDYMLEEDW